MIKVTLPEGDSIEFLEVSFKPKIENIRMPCGDIVEVVHHSEGVRSYYHKGKMVWSPKDFHRVGLMAIMLHEDSLRFKEKNTS